MSLLPKILQKSRWALKRSAFIVGMGNGLLRDRPGLRILVYHGVVPAPVKRINARFVSTTKLDAHMRFIRKHFQVVSLDQAFAKDYDPARMAVAVNFDDGYRNNLTHALPILQKHSIPATIFVSTPQVLGADILWADFLDIATALTNYPVRVDQDWYNKNRKGEFVDGKGQRLKGHCKEKGRVFVEQMLAALDGVKFRNLPQWKDYWQLMDANELREMSEANGITIGGHGTSHYNLNLMPLGAALQDVQTGLRWIEAAIGKRVNAFAFPDGAYSPALVDGVAAMSLSQILLSEYRFQDSADPRLRERFTVHPFLSTKVLMAEMLKGSYF